MEESSNGNGVRDRDREGNTRPADSGEQVAPSTSSGGLYRHHHHHHQHRHQHESPPTVSYRVSVSLSSESAFNYSELREEAWSCVVVLLTFWFFASMTLILGFYGSLNLSLGPNSSCLLQANSFFVQEIKVNADDETGPALYSFSKPPPLNVETSWFEDFKEKMAPNTHKEWVYQLNVGSEINISYSITGSSPLTLVIAEGIENLVEWIDDPSYPNTTLSWNIIQGNGSIHQKIFKESEYYVAVGNLLPDELEVKLKFGIHSLLYNVTGAYDQCKLENGLCVLKLLIFGANAAVLTTPSKKMGEEGNNWYVTLSYGPRWVTYFVGSGALTIIVLLVFKFISKFRSTSGDRIHHQSETLAPERTPLISDQDDDLSSYGSSYDSASNDEEGQEDNVGGLDSVEVKTLEEGDTNKQRRLCVICFDAPRDSFFLPCGHCAACFPCGMRISEELGSCPICNRKLKKVKKIFTV
ncbi:E3 ubiquitin-protein ligase APD2 isoform X2 [Nymphaea colorata]|uniref:E3 ubiquitin-protein ligase APD2 isoform X2 n=1 Tax=Nymphaea colorata TaxID=210225 RepID=UPI00214EF16B|nr:E3 ubiquitin-protein ligase APD2 isoform X2 [Nymphaea colorata]